MKISLHDLKIHETKRSEVIRFASVFLVLASYTLFLVLKFGSQGLYLGAITWSAFVMATPLPDGGLLIDFPIRIITGMKMVYTESIGWTTAITLNVYTMISHPEVYDKTVITQAFHQILTNPWPDWILIVISALGSFVALFFGDELLDVAFHKDRKKQQKYGYFYKYILGLFGIFLFYFLYRYILEFFGINLF